MRGNLNGWASHTEMGSSPGQHFLWARMTCRPWAEEFDIFERHHILLTESAAEGRRVFLVNMFRFPSWTRIGSDVLLLERYPFDLLSVVISIDSFCCDMGADDIVVYSTWIVSRCPENVILTQGSGCIDCLC